MLTEVFFASVSEPDAEGLRDFLFLLGSESLVEFDRSVAFATTGFVVVRIPELAC